MKHILLVTAVVVVMGESNIVFAQKPAEAEPVATPPASASAGQPALSQNYSSTVRAARRSSNTPTASATGLAANAFFTTGSRGDLIPPVMIWFSQPDPKASAELEEDLFVMARVISRTLERAEANKVNYKLGVPMLLTGSGRSVRPMYVEGQGPLFMIKVNFALMPPPKTQDKANGPATDTEWVAAQRDVFGTETAAADDDASHNSIYNESQVEAFKKELMVALKNAANIRGLKPDEFVNIAVFGHAASERTASGAGKGSVLTLRARKSAIDRFATGHETDADWFKTQVNVATYAGSGTGVTSINSWIQENAGVLRVK